MNAILMDGWKNTRKNWSSFKNQYPLSIFEVKHILVDLGKDVSPISGGQVN